MAIHDWTGAPSGFFHHFHQHWAVQICEMLNAGRLPQGYYALVERTTFGVAPDVVTLQGRTPPTSKRDRPAAIALADAPPRTRFVGQSSEAEGYAARANRIAIRDTDDEVVSVIEIVSPGNKSSRAAIRSFVKKSLQLLRQGVNLLIIDLFPPTKRDPRGIHARIWSELADDDFELPADKRLTLATYAAGVPIRTFVEPVGVGDTLPDMPTFLDPTSYIPAPLEESYVRTWDACPDEFRDRLTARPSPGADPAAGSPAGNGS